MKRALAFLGLAGIILSACRPEPTPPVSPEPSPTPEAAIVALEEIRGLPRLAPEQVVTVGSYQITMNEVTVQDGRVTVAPQFRRLSAEEIERQKQFNPFFLSASGESGIGIYLLLPRSGDKSLEFELIAPFGDKGCGARGDEPPSWEAEESCVFEVPFGRMPAYLYLVEYRAGITMFFPFIPLGDSNPVAVMPLPTLPPELTGVVPERPLPPRTPLRTASGLEVSVEEAWTTYMGLPVIHEDTGSVGSLGAGEDNEWVVVRLRARCWRSTECEGAVLVRSIDGSTAPPGLVGSVPGQVDPQTLPAGTYFDPAHPALYRYSPEGGRLLLREGEELERLLAFSVPSPATHWQVLEVIDHKAVDPSNGALVEPAHGFIRLAAETP